MGSSGAASSKMKLVLCCLALCATLSFCEDVVSPVTEITMENFVDVVIARMDGEAQMVFAKMYKVENFPAVKLFSKKDKKGVAYEGEFTSEAMASWLSDQTYEAPTLPPREPPKIITREDGTIEMTETFYHYGDGMPPM